MKFGDFTFFGFLVLVISLLLFFIIFSFYLRYFKVARKKDTIYLNEKNKYKFIVLIPARKEHRVIENLLKSLKEQTYDKNYFKVYTITENLNDKTNLITKKYGYDSIIRENLNNRHTKGFALQEAYDYLLKNHVDFNSLVIIDADNVLDKDFLKELNKLKNEGYLVGVGKRYSSNTNTNLISAQSSLLFQYQSNVINKARVNLFNKFAISGTGYYIDKSVLKLSNGWPFTGLTEDVELTRFCYHHNIKMGYNANAIFYDEQPIDFKTLHKQHIRWVWGYLNKETYKDYKLEAPRYGKTPFLARFEYRNALTYFILNEALFLIHAIYSLSILCLAFINGSLNFGFINLMIFFIDILVMFLLCGLANLIELIELKEKTNMKLKLKIKCVLFGFTFWADFLLSFLDGLFFPSKRHTWERIKHKGNN